MKKLSTYLFLLLFSFQTPSWADDITDFQVEGMSVGDSLLDYFGEEKIIKSKRRVFEHKSFYIVSIADSKFITYESIDFYLKTNDNISYPNTQISEHVSPSRNHIPYLIYHIPSVHQMETSSLRFQSMQCITGIFRL